MALGFSLLFYSSVSADSVKEEDILSSYEGREPTEVFENKETGITAYIYPKSQFQLFGAGEWDKLGTEKWTFDGRYHDGNIYKSGGGDYKIEIPPHTVKNGPEDRILSVTIYEDDGIYGRDKVGYASYNAYDEIYKYGVDIVFSGVSKLTDGLNGKAELQARFKSRYSTTSPVYVTHYD